MPAAVVQHAFRSVGVKGGFQRRGLDGCHDQLQLSAGVASAACLAQAETCSKTFQDIMRDDSKGALVVTWAFDTTPWRLRFGALQEILYPHARYAVQKDGKWTLVPLSTYQKLRPGVRMSTGVLEAFVQRATVCFADGLGSEVPQIVQHEIISPPVILQRANASNIHAAVEVSGVPEVSIDGLKRYLKAKRLLILAEAPDNASSIRKRQKAVAKMLADVPGALYAPSGCAAHKLHRAIVAATGEADWLGHVCASLALT